MTKSTNNLKSKKSGFTIVEAVMALGLITLAIGSSYAVMQLSMRKVHTAEAMMASLQEARSQMEALRLEKFISLNATGSAVNINTNGFNGRYTISAGSIPELKEIIVQIDYANYVAGGTNQVELNTVVSEAMH